MIIDTTYFQGDTNIAQLGQLAVQEKVDTYIHKYETIYLESVLGYALNKAFQAGLLIDPIDPKWLSLRDGGEYIDRHGRLNKWAGFTNIDNSPISYYVYYEYVRSEAKYLTGTGGVIPNNENAQHASPIELQVRAFNSMVRQNRELIDFIMANPGDYAEYGPYHFYHYWRNWYGSGYRLGRYRDKRLDFFTPVNPYNL